MSDTKGIKTNSGEPQSSEQMSSDETLEITINKETSEAILRNPKEDRVVRLNANFVDAIEERLEEIRKKDEEKPLTPEAFEEGLRKVDALGLKFSADLFPEIGTKNESSPELVDADELEDLEKQYPTLPREVGLIAHNVLTGETYGLKVLGGAESFKRKAKIVEELVLTDEYKAQFFFQHALKVPYLESIDWEVVVKTHERGVKGRISIPYALLMLTFHNTNPRVGRLDVHQNVTVAINRDLIDKMLATLTEVRAALVESDKVKDI